jgi:adenylate cyclase
VEQPDHRRRAILCAAAMHHFAQGFSAAAKARGIAFGSTRIGVHTGEVTVGNFGGSTIFDYRALGDPINTASRLESVNKQLGTLVCVSEATRSGAPDTPARTVGRLVLKGKSVPLLVYRPDFSADPDTSAPEADYAAAYALMEQQDPGAMAAFARLAQDWPDDPLARFHLRRLEAGQCGDVIVFSEK